MNMWKKNEDGDMGIGTMIIFIAMVLVAAVAAALVINVAYDLQQQGQDTGDQAIDDVSTGLRIDDIIGDDSDTGNDDVEDLYVYAMLHSGSQSIDITNVIIAVDDGSTLVSLTNGTSATGIYFATTYANGSAMSNDFIEQGEYIKIKIAAETAGLSLTPGTQCNIYITPGSGQTTIEQISVPTTLTTRIVDLA